MQLNLRKNKKIIALLVVVLMCIINFIGVPFYNSIILKNKIIPTLDWVSTLSEKDSFYTAYANSMNAVLQKSNLKLVKINNPNYLPGENLEVFYGVETNDGDTFMPIKYAGIDIKDGDNYISAQYILNNRKITHYYKFNGEAIINNDFEYGGDFVKGYTYVTQNDKHYIIDEKGNKITEIECSGLTNVSDDKALFGFQTEGYNMLDYKWGIVDEFGNILVKPKYNFIDNFSDDMLLVAYDENDDYAQKYEYIGNDFQVKNKEPYEEATSFYKGNAIVKDIKGWHIVDKDFNIIVDLPRIKNAGEFSDGIAVLEGNIDVKYIDKQGNVLFKIPKKFSQRLDKDMMTFKNGYIIYLDKSGKQGILNKSGEKVVPAIFDTIIFLENIKEAYVKIGNKSGIIKY